GTAAVTENDATDKMPENLPVDPEALRTQPLATRKGMFGAQGTGDTSGYGGLVKPVTMPAGAPRPWGGWFDEVADTLEARLRDAGVERAIENVVVDRGEITFHVRREDLTGVARTPRAEGA